MAVRLILLALALVFLALACGGGDDAEGYPDEVVSNFMASCEPAAVESSQGELTAEEARTQCRCVIDELQETLSLEEFREVDARAREEGFDPPDEVSQALDKCTDTR